MLFRFDYLGQQQSGSSFVNRDFVGARLEPAEILALLQLYTAGTITQKTLLDQLAQGEVLGDDFDVDEELMSTQAGGLIDMSGGSNLTSDSIPSDQVSMMDNSQPDTQVQ